MLLKKRKKEKKRKEKKTFRGMTSFPLKSKPKNTTPNLQRLRD